MQRTSTHFIARKHRLLLRLAILGAATGTFCHPARAQVSGNATGNATVNPSGVRTGTAGTNFFNAEGSNNGTNATFGVLDFAASVFNLGSQTVTGTQGGNLTVTLTESDAAFTTPGSLEFYLTTANTSSIVAGTSTLKYQSTTANGTSNPPWGIDPLLGALNGNASGTLYDIGPGTFNSTGNTNTGQVDTFTLNLSTTAAMQAFANSLNSAGGSNIRLIVAATTPTAAATFFGYTGTNTAAPTVNVHPTLSFTPTFSAANNLGWQGGSSTWTASGGTQWNPSATAGTGTTAWNNDGTHVAQFATNAGSTVSVGTGINAAGLQFDVSGYTLNAAATGNVLTLTGSSPFIQVTNAADTATVNVALGGSSGFTKSGAGTVVLGGTNTYSGTTMVSAGTLSISSDANLGNGGAVALNGGTLQTTGSPTLARAVSGSGSVGVAAGSTLTVAGVVNMGTLTLPGGGTVILTNTDVGTIGNANSAFTGLTFQTGGASLQTQNSTTGNLLGITNLNSASITAAQSSGTAGVTSNFQVTGTVSISVANSAATLGISGVVSGAAVFAKTGAGTLIINSDNQQLTGTGATPASFRQGTASATAPVSGGVVSISASNPNPGAALGVAEFQANGGTIRNDTGTAITLTVTDISLGAQDTTNTPGGHVLAGNGAITVNGPISMFNSGTTLYQHAFTVNTPTTVTGILSAAAATATKSLGLTLRGSSTLTLNAAQRGTMTEPITFATSGTGSGVVALAEGTFAANTALTINGGASLTIQTGMITGTTDAINDAALLTINGTAGTPGSFGKLVLTLGTGVREAVGGLYLPVGDGTLAAGYQPAGTYGATGSGAQFIDDTLFSGGGVIANLNTVPEPSARAAMLTVAAASLGMAAVLRRRRRGQAR